MAEDSFLPSEIARLVLGYLKKTGCSQSYQTFLNECPHLEEYASLMRRGSVYPTSIAGRDLDQILQEYGNLSLSTQSGGPGAHLYKKLDHLLQKLSGQDNMPNRHSICHTTVRSPILGGSVTYKDDSDSETDLAISGSIPNLAVLRGAGCGTHRPVLPNQLKRTSSAQSDSGISVGQRSGQAFGSSSPSLPSTNSSPCLDMPISSSSHNSSEAAINAVHQWDITPISNTSKQRKSRAQSTKNSAKVTSTISTPLSVNLPGLMGRDITVVKVPSGNFSLPLLLDSLKDAGSLQKVLRPTQNKETEVLQEPLLTKGNAAKIPTVGTSQHKTDPVNDDKGTVDSGQLEKISMQLPDFDELDSPITQHKSTPKQSSQNVPQSGQITPPNQFKTPELMRTPKQTPPISSSQTSDNLLKTPVKNFLTQEIKDVMKNSSPRRKRQPPKRRSTGVEFPLTGRLRASPNSVACAEFLDPTNSNDSFMSHGSQGFVPRIEELCQNSKFAEKLAENINRATLQKQGNKVSEPITANDASCDNKDKVKHQLSGTSFEKRVEISEDKPKHLAKNPNTRMTSEELDQILMEGETMNNIIDMTKNDPDFDILFNMFRVDKNDFIEKEYGITTTDNTQSSTSLTFANLLNSTTNTETTFSITQPEYTSRVRTVSDGSSITTSVSVPTDATVHVVDSSASGNIPAIEPITETLVQDPADVLPNPDTSLVTVSEGGAINHNASLASSNATIPDHNASMQVSEGILSADNIPQNPESSFVQLVYPSEDGKSSFYETVEVITVPGDVVKQGSTQTETGNISLLPAVTSLKPGGRSTVIAEQSNSTDEATSTTSSAAATNKELAGQGVKDALNLLSPILSPLLVSQALLLQMVRPQEGTTNSSNILQSITELQQSLAAGCTADGLAQLQHKLATGLTAGNLPANTQTKALEQLTQLVSKSTSSKPGTSTGSRSDSDVNEIEGFMDDPGIIMSTPAPKPGNRTRRLSSDENTPVRKSKLPKRAIISSSPAQSVCSDNGESESDVQEGKKVPHRTRKGGVKKVMKPRKIEPWKIDTTKDKRKFLGVVRKSGTVPAEQQPLTQASASLLMEHYEPESEATEIAGHKSKSKSGKKSNKNSDPSLPELSDNGITGAANSPRVGSTVDASCLPLISNFRHSDGVVQDDDSTIKPQTTNKKGKTTSYVRTLNFDQKGKSKPARKKSTDTKKHVTFNMEQNTPSKDICLEDEVLSSPGLSMPSSFEFVFDKNDPQKLNPSKRKTSKLTNASKDSPQRDRRSSVPSVIEDSPHRNTRSQTKTTKDEETEIAETLINLAKAPVITPKKESVSSIVFNSVVNVSKNLFGDKQVANSCSVEQEKVISRQQNVPKELKTKSIPKPKRIKPKLISKLVQSGSKSSSMKLSQENSTYMSNVNKLTTSTMLKDNGVVSTMTIKAKTLASEIKPMDKKERTSHKIQTRLPPQKQSQISKPFKLVGDKNNVDVGKAKKKATCLSESGNKPKVALTIQEKLNEITRNVQKTSTDVVPDWNSLDSPRTVVSDSSIILTSPTGNDIMRLRVASKPAVMAAREQEKQYVNANDCSSKTGSIKENSRTPNGDGKPAKQSANKKQMDAQSTNQLTSNKPSKPKSAKPNNTATITTTTLSQNSDSNIMKTPVKEPTKPHMLHSCSPKRTFTLNKLLEQSMKTLSRIDPSLGQRNDQEHRQKTSCKRRRDGDSSEKGPKPKKSKKKEDSPQVPISNLSGLDVEKFLSKLHK